MISFLRSNQTIGRKKETRESREKQGDGEKEDEGEKLRSKKTPPAEPAASFFPAHRMVCSAQVPLCCAFRYSYF